MTLGGVAPWGRLGIGTKVLENVFNICGKKGTFDSIYLHTQISNESAVDVYRKFGFEIIETKNYGKDRACRGSCATEKPPSPFWPECRCGNDRREQVTSELPYTC